ncbi:hypothetical protein DIPPA_25561 [Diplonema papillatum]|nr:hypothetical protein DIPPA_25561 [Diplonema papillatum]
MSVAAGFSFCHERYRKSGQDRIEPRWKELCESAVLQYRVVQHLHERIEAISHNMRQLKVATDSVPEVERTLSTIARNVATFSTKAAEVETLLSCIELEKARSGHLHRCSEQQREVKKRAAANQNEARRAETELKERFFEEKKQDRVRAMLAAKEAAKTGRDPTFDTPYSPAGPKEAQTRAEPQQLVDPVPPGECGQPDATEEEDLPLQCAFCTSPLVPDAKRCDMCDEPVQAEGDAHEDEPTAEEHQQNLPETEPNADGKQPDTAVQDDQEQTATVEHDDQVQPATAEQDEREQPGAEEEPAGDEPAPAEAKSGEQEASPKSDADDEDESPKKSPTKTRSIPLPHPDEL